MRATTESVRDVVSSGVESSALTGAGAPPATQPLRSLHIEYAEPCGGLFAEDCDPAPAEPGRDLTHEEATRLFAAADVFSKLSEGDEFAAQMREFGEAAR